MQQLMGRNSGREFQSLEESQIHNTGVCGQQGTTGGQSNYWGASFCGCGPPEHPLEFLLVSLEIFRAPVFPMLSQPGNSMLLP